MKVVVEDANVLFDLVNGGVLGLWLGVEFEHYTTPLVWYEVSETEQRQKVQPFIDSGLLRIQDIASGDWEEILEFSQLSNVSMSDASVWVLAKKENAILLSGDSKLRKSAKATGVEIRGLLWVFDNLLSCGKITGSGAIQALQDILAGGAFLPAEECRARIEKWGKS